MCQALTRKFDLAKDVDLTAVSEACPVTLTGADLYALCADAWMGALKDAIAKLEGLGESKADSGAPSSTLAHESLRPTGHESGLERLAALDQTHTLSDGTSRETGCISNEGKVVHNESSCHANLPRDRESESAGLDARSDCNGHGVVRLGGSAAGPVGSEVGSTGKQQSPAGLQVHQVHFMAALESLTPSLSRAELDRYEGIRAQYEGKRGKAR